MTKQLLCFLGLLLLPIIPLRSQNAEMDSLKTVLIDMPQDTNRLNILMAMSGKLYRVNPDTGIVYSQKAIDLATNLDQKEDLGYALKNIGLSYYFKSDFDEVLKYWNESLDAFRDIDDSKGISNLLNNLGAVYYSRGDDPRALEYYLESIKYAQKIGNKSRMATAHTNIGAIYAKEEATYDLARDNYNKCIEISEELGRKDALGTASLNIGQLYRKEGNLDSALEYFEKGLAAFEEVGGNIATALNFIGGIYSEKEEHAKAMKYHQDARKYALERDSKMELAQSYIGIGSVQLDQKRNNAAIGTLENALKIASEVGLNNSRRTAYEGLGIAYAGIGNYQKAYDYQTQFTGLVDSMRTLESEEKLSNLKFQFDYENKQQEIAKLNIQNDLSAAQIERDSNLQKLLLAIGSFLILGIGGIYYQFRYAKKAGALLKIERNKAEEILLNILPKDTADELKEKGYVDAQQYQNSTVLFTDFKGFTAVSETVPAEELVKSIDYYFKKFDEIIDTHNLEKIKTIGDAYMCAGGLPTKNKSNPLDAVQAAVAIMDFVTVTKANPPEGIYPFEVRIGINTGPLVAGVVGTKKFQFDIWGSTVNIASRMESNSEAGKINISESTYQQISEYFDCKYRGEIDVKNAGKQKMYYVGDLIKKILVKKEDEFV